MYRRPAYALGLLYDVCFSGKKRKLLDGGPLYNKSIKSMFGFEAFYYDPDWILPGGLKRVARNRALKNVKIRFSDRNDSISLAAFLKAWDPHFWTVFHQPDWVIRRYIKDVAEGYWSHPAASRIIDPRAARGWNIIMDVLADEEMYKQVVGPMVYKHHQIQFNSYRYGGPLDPIEINVRLGRRSAFRSLPAVSMRPSMNAQPGALSFAEISRMHDRSNGQSWETVDTLPRPFPSIFNRSGTRELQFDAFMLMEVH